MELLDYLIEKDFNIVGKELYVTCLYSDKLNIVRKIKPTKVKVVFNPDTPNVENYLQFAINEFTKNNNQKVFNHNTLHSIFSFINDENEIIPFLKEHPFNSNFKLHFSKSLVEAEALYKKAVKIESDNMRNLLVENIDRFSKNLLELNS